jgi:hypothetical protein
MARTAAQLQASLTLWYAAQDALATAQAYTLDTGQGRTTVTRANLPDINRTIAELEAELAELTEDGIMHISLERGAEVEE